MRFFRSPQDLSTWVKSLGAKKAATILVNLPKLDQKNAYDIMETSKRIVEASDENASEVLFSLLKEANVTEDDTNGIEDSMEQVRAANELLSHKVIAKDEHEKLIKKATYLRDPAVYDMPLRICPKLPQSVGKRLISTYNCRHYCLDSIVLDDDPLRVYCGELLWRRHVADKFSSDQQERKTGELYGGYINERFYKFTDAGTPANPDVSRDGGHPMELKPGERTRIPRPDQWSVERRMQEAREKGSTTDHILNKKASMDSISKSASVEQMSPQLANSLRELAIDNKFVSDDVFLNKAKLEPEIVKMIISEGISDDDVKRFRNVDQPTKSMMQNQNIKTQSSWFGKMVEAESSNNGKPVNPWAVCHTTVDSEEDPEKYERCVKKVKKENPIKKSEYETEKNIILAAGKDNFIKLSAKEIQSSNIESNLAQAFTMAVDLKNCGISDIDSVVRISNETGLTIEKVSRIQSLAIKKLAAHVSDAYIFDNDENTLDKPKVQPQERTDEEVQKSAEETGLLDDNV